MQTPVRGGVVVLDMTALLRLISDSPKDQEKALASTAIETAGDAANNITAVGAVDTGFMLNTTRARQINPKLWTIRTAAEYGLYIEFGASHVGARPWLLPAMTRALGRLVTHLREVLGG